MLCHYAKCRYADCRYAECRHAESNYAECRGTVDYTLSVSFDSKAFLKGTLTAFFALY